jgi:2-haloacid dehalogenase
MAPSVVVFDVNETLSDMTPLATRFGDLGAPPHLARLWFATVLREGFASTVAGHPERFAVLAADALRTVLHGLDLDRPLDAAVEHVLGGFADLAVHPDVPPGLRALRGAGLRLVTLSNGAAAVAERLMDRAGLRAEFERLLSVEDAGVWKPAAAAYAYAARVCGVPVEETVLVAVHPWDIDGAARAGMRTAWIDRGGDPYPGHCRPADHTITALPQLVAALGLPDPSGQRPVPG